MEKTENAQHRFGLIGRDIGYSFSRGYFTEKFEKLNLRTYSYENFDLPKIADFAELVKQARNIRGFNVTIPYKETIMPYLTAIDPEAQKIGAVNTIKVEGDDLIGHNTDAYGFQKSLEPMLGTHHSSALILGTGGASKAVGYVFDKLGIAYRYVSRSPKDGQFSYTELSGTLLQGHLILVNATPLGTYPKIAEKPPIPYDFLTADHLLFDLIYNPSKTAFLKEGEQRGAAIQNGLRMLELQAEKAWELWTNG